MPLTALLLWVATDALIRSRSEDLSPLRWGLLAAGTTNSATQDFHEDDGRHKTWRDCIYSGMQKGAWAYVMTHGGASGSPGEGATQTKLPSTNTRS